MKKLIIASLVVASGFATADEEKTFTLNGEFGMNITTGNSETQSFNAGLTSHQELESWSNDYVFNGLYKKETTEDDDGVETETTSAQKIFASAQGNYKLNNPDNRLFVFTSYENDRLSNFDYQATIAAGWSEKVWGNETSSFEYSIGPGYSFSETQSGVSQDSAIVRGSLAYHWTISETAQFTQTLSTEVGSENTKSRSETSLTASISGALSMKFSVGLDHNSDVDEGVENLDTQTAITLVYTFF